MHKKFFRKISLILLSVLTVLGVAYVFITVSLSQTFYQETNQQLYGSLAGYVSMELEEMTKDSIDAEEIKTFLHRLNVANPAVEVYFLDEKGEILFSDIEPSKLARTELDLVPINKFIDAEKKPFILGNDPKDLKCELPFSAAKIKKTAALDGYVYILLSSEQMSSVNTDRFFSLIPRIGGIAFAFALLIALGVGLFANWLVTRNLAGISKTVQRFKDGDYSARIEEEDKGDFMLLGDTFNEMAAKIEENITSITSLEKLRRDLIANVSHDLRTPLSIMQGYVETLLMKNEDLPAEKRKHYLNIVLNSAQSLSDLVSQLFEYSKLEARQVEPKKEHFALTDLVQDVAAKYKLPTEAKSIELNTEIKGIFPLVFADISLIERVLQNLMDNALKFTPEGGRITLKVSRVKEQTRFGIADTGSGIPPDELPHIFARYHQAQKNAEKSKGAGLGLSISQKILEIHGSELRVTSEMGKGTEFWFVL